MGLGVLQNRLFDLNAGGFQIDAGIIQLLKRVAGEGGLRDRIRPVFGFDLLPRRPTAGALLEQGPRQIGRDIGLFEKKVGIALANEVDERLAKF